MTNHEEILKLKEFLTKVLNDLNKIELTKTPISRLNLSNRAQNCLMRYGIKCVEDLIVQEKSTLLRVRNLGDITFSEINRCVKAFGFLGWD